MGVENKFWVLISLKIVTFENFVYTEYTHMSHIKSLISYSGLIHESINGLLLKE